MRRSHAGHFGVGVDEGLLIDASLPAASRIGSAWATLKSTGGLLACRGHLTYRIEGTYDMSRALRQVQKIIRFVAVRRRLKVLACLVHGDDDPYGLAADAGVEVPPPCVVQFFQLSDDFVFRQIPRLAVENAAEPLNPLMRIEVAVTLCDARYLY
jgi:hypothetical protein